jgi:nucleoside-diphosphate-sugar epimerase
MKKHSYIITGHKGLIGIELKKRLDKEGHKCIIAVDKKEKYNEYGTGTWQDVCNLSQNRNKNLPKMDVMYHFAAHCKINQGVEMPELPHKNNTHGIYSVLEFCRDHKIPRIVVASSSRVLSKERNPYVASKIYAEELTKAYAECYGLEYIIVRPSTVFNAGKDDTNRLMNIFITNAIMNKPLKIYGDKTKTLDFTFVDDFVDGVMIACAQKKWNEDYNIGGEQETNLTELANYIIHKTHSKSKIMYQKPEIAQPQHVCVDICKIQSLGYKPKYSVWRGVDKALDFFSQYPNFKSWSH